MRHMIKKRAKRNLLAVIVELFFVGGGQHVRNETEKCSVYSFFIGIRK
jgi:hypothetical protein